MLPRWDGFTGTHFAWIPNETDRARYTVSTSPSRHVRKDSPRQSSRNTCTARQQPNRRLPRPSPHGPILAHIIQHEPRGRVTRLPNDTRTHSLPETQDAPRARRREEYGAHRAARGEDLEAVFGLVDRVREARGTDCRHASGAGKVGGTQEESDRTGNGGRWMRMRVGVMSGMGGE